MWDTYTVLLASTETNGRYRLIDMCTPPGGPAPHRHDFEESFTLLDGELEFTFRVRTADQSQRLTELHVQHHPTTNG